MIVENKSCLSCGSSNLLAVLSLRPSPLAGDFLPKERLKPHSLYPLDLILCCDCGLVQLKQIIEPKVFYDQYSYTTSSSPGLAEYYAEYASAALSKFSVEDSFVLEIGSNDGTLLAHFRDKGVRVLGVEPARHIATAAGVETLPAYFSSHLAREIVSSYGRPRLIVCNYTFANLPDLQDFAEGLRILLPPDGIFMMETGYLLDIVRSRLFDNIYHEHYAYFSVASLERFFLSKGFDLVDVEWFPTKGGAIRCTVCYTGKLQKSASVARFKSLESLYRLETPETYRRLAEDLECIRERLLAFLDSWSGARFAGYGACQSATTLMYHFQIGEKLFCLVDDNTAKHFTFSPGLHLPVLPSETIEETKPDGVVILAWRYAERIIAKHPQFRGLFILPLPDVSVR